MLDTNYATIVNYAIIGQEFIKAEEQRSTDPGLKVDWAVKRSNYISPFGFRQLERLYFSGESPRLDLTQYHGVSINANIDECT